MAANVESMFYVREKPWHGLGTQVTEAPTSRTALKAAGLDWNVIQQDVFNSYGYKINGYKANIRESDMTNLGIVSDRYKVVQNEDAFRFTDNLLEDGVVYETAGSLQSGKKVWLLARMPEKYIINGDEIEPFFLLMNSHDGSSGIKACMTPIRVVCNNTLNLAISTAKRIWTSKHTENIHGRLEEAHETFNFAQKYMTNLGKVIDCLNRIKLSDKKVLDMMSDIVPVAEEMTAIQTLKLYIIYSLHEFLFL